MNRKNKNQRMEFKKKNNLTENKKKTQEQKKKQPRKEWFCRLTDELPFQLIDGNQPCMINIESVPKYHILEIEPPVIVWKGISGKKSKIQQTKCDKLDFNVVWFSNLDVASIYEKRKSRPQFKFSNENQYRHLPCGWVTTKKLRLINLTNISNLRNFQADSLELIKREYKALKGKHQDNPDLIKKLTENEQKDLNDIKRKFKLLYGINPLLGDININRNSIVEEDAKIFTNMCKDIAAVHNIDGYITWAMNSKEFEWNGKSLFHPEMMICQPKNKMRNMTKAEEDMIVDRINSFGQAKFEFIKIEQIT